MVCRIDLMSRIYRVLFFFGLVSLILPLSFSRQSQAAPVPMLKIDGPIDGQVIESFVVDLKFSLKNFTLKDYKQLPKNNPNQGHMHIWLNQDSPTKDNAIMYFKSSPYTFADVSSGKHTLVVELVNNDHTSFDPQIIQTIKFETKAPAGSQSAPLNSQDAPKVAVSTSGEVPTTPTPAASVNGGFISYLIAGVVTLILGLLGVVLLKR